VIDLNFFVNQNKKRYGKNSEEGRKESSKETC
jgi:hypothetical protein